MDYLSDIEQQKIIAFNNDPILVEAVRKVLLATIYTNGTLRKDLKSEPTRNAALSLVALAQSNGVVSNQDLGEDLRGLYQGISLVEKGLMKLSEIKSPVEAPKEPQNNPAV